MLAVGLTGGIGSGKSTVADLLVERGAVLIDADGVAREVVEPGGAAYGSVVERFGPGILSGDGTIDRPALAAIVFADPKALADLNSLTHPAIGVVMATRCAAERGSDHVVILDIPLLGREHRDRFLLDVVVVVDCPPEIALERLVAQRAMSIEDALARMTAQMSREERRARADVVIDNSGDLSDLVAQVDQLWPSLRVRAADHHAT